MEDELATGWKCDPLLDRGDDTGRDLAISRGEFATGRAECWIRLRNRELQSRRVSALNQKAAWLLRDGPARVEMQSPFQVVGAFSFELVFDDDFLLRSKSEAATVQDFVGQLPFEDA